MKKLLSIVAAAGVFLSFGGCVMVSYGPSRGGERLVGSGTVKSQEFEAAGYTTVELRLGAEIIYSSEPSDTITIEMHENLFDYLEVEQVGDRLKISSTRDIATNNTKVPTVYLSTPDLERLEVWGAMVWDGGDTIEQDTFDLDVNGACSITMDLKVNQLNLDVAGASSVELSGTAESFNLDMSGVSSIEADRLEAKNVMADISGMGMVTVHCTQQLDVKLSGAGSLEYKGNPTVNKKISGAGTVSQMN